MIQRMTATPRVALALLGTLNIFSMTDRYLLPGVQVLVQRELQLNDQKTGALTSAFFIAFLVGAPAVGWLGDRLSRKLVIGYGALGWSALTCGTAYVHTYRQLYWFHVAVGLGEVSLSILALAFVADLYPQHKRTQAFAALAVTTPIGASLGYVLGE